MYILLIDPLGLIPVAYPVYYLNKSSLVILLCLVTVRPSYQDRISAADALPAFSKKTQMK